MGSIVYETIIIKKGTHKKNESHIISKHQSNLNLESASFKAEFVGASFSL